MDMWLNDLSANPQVAVGLNIILACICIGAKSSVGKLMMWRFLLYGFLMAFIHTVEVDHIVGWVWYAVFITLEFIFARVVAERKYHLTSILITGHMLWLVVMSISAVYGESNQLNPIHFVITVSFGIMIATSTYFKGRWQCGTA